MNGAQFASGPSRLFQTAPMRLHLKLRLARSNPKVSTRTGSRVALVNDLGGTAPRNRFVVVGPNQANEEDACIFRSQHLTFAAQISWDIQFLASGVRTLPCRWTSSYTTTSKDSFTQIARKG